MWDKNSIVDGHLITFKESKLTAFLSYADMSFVYSLNYLSDNFFLLCLAFSVVFINDVFSLLLIYRYPRLNQTE